MSAGMLYALLIGLALTAAAVLLEEPIRRANGSARSLWLGTVIATVLVPVVLWFAPRPAAPGAPHISLSLRDGHVVVYSPDRVSAPAEVSITERQSWLSSLPTVPVGYVDLGRLAGAVWAADLDRFVRWILWLGPAVVLLALMLDSLRFTRRSRLWRSGEVDGTPVALSIDFGPAIVGLMRPRVVLPAWVADLDEGDRSLVITHESEHLRAHDPRILALAWVAVAATPWNPMVWWQLRRLRVAIELDCDRRVLGRGSDGADVNKYATLLLEANRRRAPEGMSTIFSAAFAERGHSLKHRIIAMTEPAAPFLRTGSVPRLSAVAVMVIGVSVVRPPTVRDEIRAALARSGGGTFDIGSPPLAPFVGDSIFADAHLEEDDPKPTQDPPITARDLPNRFVPATAQGDDGIDAIGCPSVLLDPRDSTRLVLVGSAANHNRWAEGLGERIDVPDARVGYYLVHGGDRYGVRGRQRLRVGCPPPIVTVPVDVPALSEAVRQRLGHKPESVLRKGAVLMVRVDGLRIDPDYPAEALDSLGPVVAGIAWREYPRASELSVVKVILGVDSRSAIGRDYGRDLTGRRQ